MNKPRVLDDTTGSIATITLKPPEVKNAFSTGMIRLWNRFLKKARSDDRIKVVVVTGKRDAFCSGGDIEDMADGKLRSWTIFPRSLPC